MSVVCRPVVRPALSPCNKLTMCNCNSDANHKSSWYHYLKYKCHGKPYRCRDQCLPILATVVEWRLTIHVFHNFITDSSACPQRGCFECPRWDAPGKNPYFQERHKQAEHIRARDFIESGEADKWRKVVEL